MRKRLYWIVMAFVLCTMLSTVSARAEGIAASGTCGDNLTWTLDDAGTLTISGTGAFLLRIERK